MSCKSPWNWTFGRADELEVVDSAPTDELAAAADELGVFASVDELAGAADELGVLGSTPADELAAAADELEAFDSAPADELAVADEPVVFAPADELAGEDEPEEVDGLAAGGLVADPGT